MSFPPIKTGLPLMPATGPVRRLVGSSALQMMTGRCGPMKFSTMPTTCIGKLSMRVPETTVCHSPVIPGLMSDNGITGVLSSARTMAEVSGRRRTTVQKPGMSGLIFMGRDDFPIVAPGTDSPASAG